MQKSSTELMGLLCPQAEWSAAPCSQARFAHSNFLPRKSLWEEKGRVFAEHDLPMVVQSVTYSDESSDACPRYHVMTTATPRCDLPSQFLTPAPS